MSAIELSHPNAAQLASFASGQVSETVATAISLHLADCPVCRTVVEALPHDTLLSLLRKPPQEVAEAPAATTCVVASLATDPDRNLPPELVSHPRYHILERLGTGGMGSVYKATHRLMERPVALKLINPGLMNRPAVVERFRREVKAVAQLSHPHIVTAYDADQAGEAHFLIMEYVEGISLAQHVEQHGPLSVAQACDYIRQAALGLQFAADHGLVHRDIKPHNLMVTPGEQVKILDFGLARIVREEAAVDAEEDGAEAGYQAAGSLTEVGTLMGTADFLAPEQAADPRQADNRADLYSLGCTLYFLLTGSVPFPGGNVVDKLTAHREHKPAPLSKLRGDIPATLAAVLDRMMAKDPTQRYQTPARTAEALRPFTTAATALRRRIRRLVRTAAALAASLLLAAAILYIQTDNGEIVIETNDDRVAVLIDAKGVKIRDLATNREYRLKIGRTRLHAGEYQIEVQELPAGVEFLAESFTLKRGDKTAVAVRFNTQKDPGYLRDEALRWFPAEATFFSANNMEVFPDLWRLQLLIWMEMGDPGKRWTNHKGDRFRRFVDFIGEMHRVAFGYAINRQHPDQSRYFLRFTGSIKHNRLVDFFRQEWTDIRIEQTESEGVPITLIHDARPGGQLGIAVALIGKTDLLLAGYLNRVKNDREVIRECLELRAGRGTNLPQAQAKALKEIPPHAWSFGVGEPPAYLFGTLLPVILAPPRSFVMSLAGTTEIEIRFRGSFSSDGEAKRFLTLLTFLKQAIVKIPIVSDNPKVSAGVAKGLGTIRVESEADRLRVSMQVPRVVWDEFLEKMQDIPLRDYLRMRGLIPEKGK